MKFNKNYDVTNLVKNMIRKGDISCYNENLYVKIFVYEDVRDFGINRIQKDINDDFMPEKGKYMIENNLIDKYDFIEAYEEKYNVDLGKIDNKKRLEEVIDSLPLINKIETIIFMDDDKGLENEEFLTTNSLESAIEIATDGEDIIELN